MKLYTLLLFAHILGVLGLFIGMGLQWVSVLRLRRAQTRGQANEWISLARGAGRLSPIAGVLVLGAGIAMMAMRWTLTTPWIMVSLLAIVLMMVAGMGVSARRIKASGRALAQESGGADDPLTLEMKRLTHNPALWIATQLAAGQALGVVFMMTVKPELVGSLLTLAVALALGAAAGVATAKPRRRPDAATTGKSVGAAMTTYQLPTAGEGHSR